MINRLPEYDVTEGNEEDIFGNKEIQSLQIEEDIGRCGAQKGKEAGAPIQIHIRECHYEDYEVGVGLKINEVVTKVEITEDGLVTSEPLVRKVVD